MEAVDEVREKELERAAAITAHERQGYSELFEDWASRNPKTADALARLRGLPDLDRLRTRTLAMRPFKADLLALTPKQEDRDRAANANAAKEAGTAAFFNLPRRRVGRRIP